MNFENIKNFNKINKINNWINYILPSIFSIFVAILIIEYTYILFFDTNFSSNNISNINHVVSENNKNDFLFQNQLPLQLCPQIIQEENINDFQCENYNKDNKDNKNNKEEHKINNQEDDNLKISEVVKENSNNSVVAIPKITKHNHNKNLPNFINSAPKLTTAEQHFLNAENFVNNNDWKNAQQEFFNAYNLQQQNPIYAYNLAISLEQLQQINFAIKYYNKTIEIIEANPNNKATNKFNNLFTNEKLQSIKQHILLLQQSQ